MILNTFIFIPVRNNFIGPCLETLWKYTDMENCRVIVIDQTKDQEIGKRYRNLIHLTLSPHRNLGFAKAMNEGIIHGVRWNSQYITCSNDDLEFIDKRWWQGILDTFAMDEKIIAVNPMSPAEPKWGYGAELKGNVNIIPYEERFNPEKYNYLLEGDYSDILEDPDVPKNFYVKRKGSLFDAITTWCTVFKRGFFEKVGYFEERFYPGAGEDIDLCARAYSKGYHLDPSTGKWAKGQDSYRMVSTPKSWVWHLWGASKDNLPKTKEESLPIEPERMWNKIGELYPNQDVDIWGRDKKTGEPLKRVPVGVIDI